MKRINKDIIKEIIINKDIRNSTSFYQLVDLYDITLDSIIITDIKGYNKNTTTFNNENFTEYCVCIDLITQIGNDSYTFFIEKSTYNYYNRSKKLNNLI